VTTPLEGITVIEVDNYMAAPSAAAILADLGARVIKVEPPGGDPMRGIGRPAKIEGALKGYDFGFDVDNRGKQSVAVALDTDEGMEVVHRLVRMADVFLCNLMPHRQKRFGLDPERLMTLNPKLVHATLTGYGTNGPDALRPGYDVTAFFGRSGLYDAMREGDDGDVPMARPAQGDHTSGLALVGAILAALRLAERTGEGQVVETSLYETAIWTQATDFAVTAVDGAPVRRRSRREQLGPAANRYPCGDGKWIVLNTLGGHAWEKLCAALGRADWLEEEKYRDGSSRYRHMAELVDAIDGILAGRSRDEWGEVFDRVGLVWGPVLTLDEVASDRQSEAIGMFPVIEHATRGSYRSVRIPMRFHSADVRPRGPAPAIGEHTQQVLRDAGYTPEDIDRLLEEGAIRSA
jgi:crotonobetainyl-CoA:carnitine CoA-transferase CaiB-like acyl-CoA transferase